MDVPLDNPGSLAVPPRDFLCTVAAASLGGTRAKGQP